MEYKQRNWAEIKLDNLKHNVERIKETISNNAKILGVIKADGYGTGSVRAAEVLRECGVDFFAVACVEEAIALRNAGAKEDILILGYTGDKYLKEIFDYDITPTVFDKAFAKSLSDYAVKRNKKIKIHIKLDTGMGRIGFLTNPDHIEKTSEEILEISSLPMLEIEGIFTHFALADDENTAYTESQFERFMKVNEELKARGLDIKIKHCANSAAIMMYPKTHLDMVRPGIILYGCYPSPYLEGKKFELKPVMEFKTKIINLKEVEPGCAISYGCTFVTERKSKIATIPVGYADGLSRNLSGKYSVLVNGQYAPIVGRICMDQCMIDVTDVNNISTEDEVVIFGEQKGVKNPIEKMAEILGTINYEILCDIGKRVPRVYFKNGEPVEIQSLVF